MTSIQRSKGKLWEQYHSIIEDFQSNNDKEEVLSEFRKLLMAKNPTPSVDLLSELAKRFMKLKQIDDAKKAYGLILQTDSTHRKTWKQLSSLYFK